MAKTRTPRTPSQAARSAPVNYESTPAGTDLEPTDVRRLAKPAEVPDPDDDLPEAQPIPDPRPRRVAGQESDATAAAGPHRPEPAKQIYHNPPIGPLFQPSETRRAVANIKVMATQDGYIYEARRRTGDVFALTDSKHFSKKWMVRVGDHAQEKTSTGRDVLKKQHDAIVGARLSGNEAGSGRATGDDNPLDA